MSDGEADLTRARDLHPSASHRSEPASTTAEPAEGLLAPLLAVDSGPAVDWSSAPEAWSLARPDELPEGEVHLTVSRSFCFADLSGFTRLTRDHGAHVAVKLLADFRRVTRNVAAKRGVRVAKWLGDGVMLVGTQKAAVIAVGGHLIHSFGDSAVQVRVGVTTGPAHLFEGDDYIGEAVNLAAKLCSAARPGEMLAVGGDQELPEWIQWLGDVSVEIRGVGRIGGIQRLQPALDPANQ